MKRDYNSDIYKMYEEEFAKNEKANETIKSLKLEIYTLKADLKQSNNKIDNAINKATATLKEENQKLQNDLVKALEEIDRLKSQINNSNLKYTIDKLANQLNKDSSNSGIPTSKEIGKKKTGPNTYNHREKNTTKLADNMVIKATL